MRNLTRALLAALSVLFLVSCGNAQQSASNSHACADKVAQATTTTSAVPGLWDCLTGGFQNRIKAVGAAAKVQPDAVLSIGVALSAKLIGIDAQYATYDLLLNPSAAQQTGQKTVEITVWLDPAGSGKVDNVGVAVTAF